MSKQIYDVPELLQESLVTLAEAAKLFPVPVALSTLERFMRRGSGDHVLESVKIAGRRFTSKEAVERFILSGLRLPPDQPSKPIKRVGMSDAEMEAARLRFRLPKPGRDGKTYEELEAEQKK